MLERFFAVTANEHARSLYQVDRDNGSDLHFPRAVKIALRGWSYYDVGHVHVAPIIVIADKLHFCCSGELRPQDDPDPSIDGRRIVSSTSLYLGLFLDEAMATECFRDTCRLTTINPFWIMRTDEVIQSIGDRHPVFKVSATRGAEFSCNMLRASA